MLRSWRARLLAQGGGKAGRLGLFESGILKIFRQLRRILALEIVIARLLLNHGLELCD